MRKVGLGINPLLLIGNSFPFWVHFLVKSVMFLFLALSSPDKRHHAPYTTVLPLVSLWTSSVPPSLRWTLHGGGERLAQSRSNVWLIFKLTNNPSDSLRRQSLIFPKESRSTLRASSLGYTVNSLQIRSKKCSWVGKNKDKAQRNDHVGLLFFWICVHIGFAQPDVGRIYLSLHTARHCHVQSVDIWGLFHVSLLHLPSLKHLETSVTKPSMKRESSDN